MNKNRIGETQTMNCGLKAKIINYVNNKDIDIEFEDGKIIKHKAYNSFKRGIIKHPSVHTTKAKYINKRIGEINTAKNGMKMTIVAYKDCDNIDIEFEDGLIIHNQSYKSFRKGFIKHPDKKRNTIYASKHINEIGIANNGLRMKIIAYRNTTDIDIKFEDGFVVKHKRYSEFKKGHIQHPNIDTTLIKYYNERINQSKVISNGMRIKIIAYRNSRDIDIICEDGTVIKNKQYYDFKLGKIKFPKMINNIALKEFAYKFNNSWYYICSNPGWIEDKILSTNEITNWKN